LQSIVKGKEYNSGGTGAKLCPELINFAFCIYTIDFHLPKIVSRYKDTKYFLVFDFIID
jgi:hypothetical protein